MGIRSEQEVYMLKKLGLYILLVLTSFFYLSSLTYAETPNTPINISVDKKEIENKCKELLNAGYGFMKNNNFTEALDCFNQILQLDRHFAQAYHGRAIAYRMMDNINEAIAEYGRAIIADPDNASFYYIMRAQFRLQLDIYDEKVLSLCAQDMIKGCNVDVNSSDAYFLWAYIYFYPVSDLMSNESNDNNNRSQYFLNKLISYNDEALRLNPQNYQALNMSGLIKCLPIKPSSKENYFAAVDDFTKALAIHPNHQSYQDRGFVYAKKLNEIDLAISDFYNVIIGLEREDMDKEKKDSAASSAYEGLGYCYVKKGDYKSALKNYNLAIEKNSKAKASHNNRGIIYAMQGEYDKAADDFNQGRYAKTNLKLLNGEAKGNEYIFDERLDMGFFFDFSQKRKK